LSERHGNVAEGERDEGASRLAGETANQGYPEEAPPGSDPSSGEGSGPREGAKPPRKHDDQRDETDDGKATGNRRSAG
jgi:hypothetical protein